MLTQTYFIGGMSGWEWWAGEASLSVGGKYVKV